MTNDERDQLLVELRLRLEGLQSDVDQIKHVLLEGNGKPPLTEQVLKNTYDLDRLKEERDDRKVPRAAWIGIVLSSALGIAGIISSLS